jgi:GntR family transcriptional regulator, galactonate operon transcriptional repressor
LSPSNLYPSKPLHGQVAHDIGRQICSGSVAEGAVLPRESELSSRYGVSRQAIREALKVLAAKGLVKSRRRAGTYVTPRTDWNLLDPDVLAWHDRLSIVPSFFADLAELRRLIEPAAAEFAAERASPQQLERIGEALAALMRMAEVGDIEAYNAADAEFHKAVFAASGNALIDRLSTILGPLLEVTFKVQSQANPGFQGAAVHGPVFEAIAARAPARARKAMEGVLDVAAAELARAEARNAGTGRERDPGAA